MKLIRQTLWIIFFTFIGEILNKVLPLPVPDFNAYFFNERSYSSG